MNIIMKLLGGHKNKMKYTMCIDEKLNILKIASLPKIILRKILVSYSVECDKLILIFIKRNGKILLKKKHVGGLPLPT